MDIDRYNREGYVDPTPRKAIRNIDRETRMKARSFRPVVYICSPFRGDTERNVENARQYCRLAVSRGAIPYAPHLLLPQFMDDENDEERELALFMGQVMLDKCAEVWVFGKEPSEGMKMEIERARQKNKKIRYFSGEVDR